MWRIERDVCDRAVPQKGEGGGVRLPIDIELTAEDVSIPDARRFVADGLDAAGVDGVVAADLLIVVSELVSNAVMHGAGGPMQLVVRDVAGRIEITVVSPGGADVGPVHTWTMPPPGAVGGRGLALVRALVDQVEACGDGSSFAVTASRRR
jgi:anti-sigma regulatory factor (Ser/Thr protein kinase)